MVSHIAGDFHPGAQLAVARHGKLALYRGFGNATVDPSRPVDERTLFPLFSNTKVITAAAVWTLVEEGKLRFSDRVAEHVPGFEAHGKEGVTVAHLLTHQAGFPAAEVTPECFMDRERLRRAVCEFKLEWPPGSRSIYHRTAAHWVVAVLIEAITGNDYRDEIRKRVIEPLRLTREMFLGLPEAEDHRAAAMYTPRQTEKWPLDPMVSAPLFRRSGIPGAGGYATARAMAVFYQMMAQGGTWGGVRIVSPRMIDYVTRDFTGDLVDDYTGYPMHRGLGPFSLGQSGHPGLGAIGHPRTFGHSGVGTSYCWADPTSGLSFAFLSNCRRDNAWHNKRMDTLSTLIHASILG
ncbi:MULTISPECIES: serine hydrolase domain-containing protein [Bradyrhizobium]|uniref:CubicO group peptidase, beta-lactamase class C family n=2 Tax=Bradyrhizobium TaxID=374 RepID=A0ABY0Q070_9BRAD|nr:MULTISPECIES: serine hydrolase domain-containing protein [Bradyrhizobium]SDJ27677.1 CubicO group peptidase, beta-lactamase class C family [Bradyrhizobium ottawaense]SEC74106.1 CubicO group peptidase, beta-lactamase class C family [Bradyrhizobium lablabi]